MERRRSAAKGSLALMRSNAGTARHGRGPEGEGGGSGGYSMVLWSLAGYGGGDADVSER